MQGKKGDLRCRHVSKSGSRADAQDAQKFPVNSLLSDAADAPSDVLVRMLKSGGKTASRQNKCLCLLPVACRPSSGPCQGPAQRTWTDPLLSLPTQHQSISAASAGGYSGGCRPGHFVPEPSSRRNSIRTVMTPLDLDSYRSHFLKPAIYNHSQKD